MTPLPPEMSAQSDPLPFQTPQFRPISAHSASTVTAGEKSSLSINRKSTRAFQRAIDEPCTLPLSLSRGGTKREFAIFPVNFYFCLKMSATKFLCVKMSSSKVVATSFLYLMVRRWVAGYIPIHQKFALKVTHPFRKR